MKLGPIINALRLKCPSFESRVAGAAEFSKIDDSTVMNLPCAFVVPLGETAEQPINQTDYRQTVEQNFSVIVYVSTETDERGLIAYDRIEELKLEVMKAICGWEPIDNADPISYAGASILSLNKARLCVQLEFSILYDIVDNETRHGVDLGELPNLEMVHVDVDLMFPDGLIEAQTDIKLGEN